MKIKLAALLLAGIALMSPVRAEVIDLATVKCSDLATMSEEDGAFFFVWLHGYYGGQSGDTTMDVKAMEESGKAIGEYCAANPEVGVLSAVSQALDAQ